ncbi:MAG: hypothetical protein HQK77_20075, partial [Desulfobacterales bacterium]|nr:hypothetical protein [Desulfobacterales bacterium]
LYLDYDYSSTMPMIYVATVTASYNNLTMYDVDSYTVESKKQPRKDSDMILTATYEESITVNLSDSSNYLVEDSLYYEDIYGEDLEPDAYMDYYYTSMYYY